MSRFVVLLVAAILLASPGAASERVVPPGAGAATPAPVLPERFSPSEFARALLAETNRVRREHNRRPLKARAELNAAADDQAAFMALRMQVQHGSFLRGQDNAADRVRRHGLEGLTVAENVASTSLSAPLEQLSAAQIAALLVAQWMESPGHRANLLDRRLTQFGGSVRLTRLGEQWSAYGVQVFLIPRPPFGRVSA